MKVLHTAVAAALAISCGILLSNCQKDKDLPYKYESEKLNLPATPYNYSNPEVPKHFIGLQSMVNAKVTDAGATLGRVLFYDTKLSLTNKTACGSCHFQEKGFSDGKKFSPGFDGGMTKRNASSIVNPILTNAFFWDARETELKSMVLQPIKNHVEMGMDNFDALQKKLASIDYYGPLFENAFGSREVTKDRIAEALSQFLNAMTTTDSKFDDSEPTGWGSGNSLVFNDQERLGSDLFFGKARCANCHNPGSSFFGNDFQETWADIGLEVNYADKGVGANNPGMEGMFKIPSLRNITLTGPYMHDGRFETLMDVVNHYNDNIQASPNLNWSLRDNNNEPVRMGLTDEEKLALVAFLGTFTDLKFTSDPRFADPFK